MKPKNWSYTTKGILLFIALWVALLFFLSIKFMAEGSGSCHISLYPTSPGSTSFGNCFTPLFFGLTFGFPIILVGSLIFGLIGRAIGKRKAKTQGLKKHKEKSVLLIIISVILGLILLSFLFTLIRFMSFLG